MKREELIEKLKELKINPRHYSLDGRVLNDSSIVLEPSKYYTSNGKLYTLWRVFRFERGSSYDEQTFNTEEEACEFIYKELLNLQSLITKFKLKD